MNFTSYFIKKVLSSLTVVLPELENGISKLSVLTCLALLSSSVVYGQSSPGSCGITIITHGFQKFTNNNDPIPQWVFSMAKAIKVKSKANTPVYIAKYVEYGLPTTIGDHFKLKKVSDDFQSYPDIADGEIDLTLTGGAIIIIDWVAISDELLSESTTDVADLFWADVVARTHNKGHAIYEVPIHLIGHSRGASLNSRLAYRFAQNGIMIDQQTSLDGHPVNSGLINDHDLKIYDNVIFSDSYYREGGIPEGEVTKGSLLNDNLTNRIISDEFTKEHSDVHTYYHATIDTNVGDDGDGGVIQDEWFSSPYISKNKTGYAFSRYLDDTWRPRDGLGKNNYYKYGNSDRIEVEDYSTAFAPNVFFDQDDLATYCRVGDSHEIKFHFIDKKSQQSISIFLDSNTNPYDGTLREIIEGIVKTNRSQTIGFAGASWIPQETDVGGPSYIGIKTQNSYSGLIRYDYYLRPIYISSALSTGPKLTTIAPLTFEVKPTGQTQTLTLDGTGFTSASTLVFTVGNNTVINSTAANLTFVNSTQLRYLINVGQGAADWSVKVVNAGVESNPLSFTVKAPSVVLTSLSIFGASSVNESTTTQYTAFGNYSDNTSSPVTATWSLTGSGATINAATGKLTSSSVDGDTYVTLSATATAGGVTKSASPFPVTIVNIAGDGTSEQHLIANGNFSDGLTSWTKSGDFYADSRFTTYRSSPAYAYLSNSNGTGGDGLSGDIKQAFQIPANASSAKLSYWYRITTSEANTMGKDFMFVRLLKANGDLVAIVDVRTNLNANTNYEERTFDLTSYKSQSLVLSFDAINDSTSPSVFRIDDVSLIATTPSVAPPATTSIIEVTRSGIPIYSGSTEISVAARTDFSSHWMGETSALYNYRINNSGSGDLTLTGSPYVKVQGSSSFTIEIQPTSPIAPDSNSYFKIRFDPLTPGQHLATIVITSNDPNIPLYTFQVGGEGMFRDTAAPELSVSTPTSNAAFSTNSSTVALAGTASDNVRVSEVAWTNDRGGSGFAIGTNSWTASVSGLTSGVNVLTITARDDVGNFTTKTLAVTYIPSIPEITLTPILLRQTANQGQNGSSQTFTIRNSGSNTLSYSFTASSTGNWLSVTPPSGTSTGEEDTITVNYASSGLAVGTYSGTISVAATGAVSTPISLPVTLRVTNVNPSEPYVGKSLAQLDPSLNIGWHAQSQDGNLIGFGRFSGTITIGTQTLTSSGDVDFYAVKFTKGGNIVWIKQYGGVNEDQISSCVQHPSGGWLISGEFRVSTILGTTTLTSAGKRDGFMAKLDENGNVLWAKRAGGVETDNCGNVAVDGGGNCIAFYKYLKTISLSDSSSTFTNSGSGWDILVAKYSASGAFIWAKTFGGLYYDELISVNSDSTGNIYFGGYFTTQSAFGPYTLTEKGTVTNGNDGYAVKLNSSGSVVWVKQFGEPAGSGYSGDSINNIHVLSDGTVYVSGNYNGPMNVDGKILALQTAQTGFCGRITPNGSVEWLKAVTGTNSIFNQTPCYDSIPTSDGGIILNGLFYGSLAFASQSLTIDPIGTHPPKSYQYFLKYDNTGNPLWISTVYGSGDDTSGVGYLYPESNDNIGFIGLYNGSVVTMPSLPPFNITAGNHILGVIGPKSANLSPTISDVSNKTINEDISTGAITFTVDDVDTSIANLVVTATSSNKTLVPDANITLSGSSGSRTITIQPFSNLSGSTVITLFVSDGQVSASDTFTLTVSPVNDAPTKPTTASPLAGATNVSISAVLQSSAFSDIDAGDSHAASQWQVLDSSETSMVWDSGEDAVNRVSKVLPGSSLDYGKSYRWRVRHKDAQGAWSDYSQSSLFTTVNPPVPVLTTGLSLTGFFSTSFSHAVSASNNPTSYAATGLPSGLSINAFSGEISGFPAQIGTFLINLSATNLGGTGIGSLTLVIQPSFGYYQKNSFTSAELLNTSISGPTADPDRDGINNLMEYAFALNPKQSNQDSFPAVSTSGGYLNLRFIRRKDTPDLTYIVEVSSDAINWSSTFSSTVQESVSIIDSQRDQVVVRDATPVNGSSRRFIRLRIMGK